MSERSDLVYTLTSLPVSLEFNVYCKLNGVVNCWTLVGAVNTAGHGGDSTKTLQYWVELLALLVLSSW